MKKIALLLFLVPLAIGCNNGNSYITGDDDKDFHDDLEMEMNELR